MTGFQPHVELLESFSHSNKDIAVSAARTCYSQHLCAPASTKTVSVGSAERIFNTVAKAGHHTTLQHAHYVFGLSNVSRHFVWWLHSHRFYNSEQQSQRYVEMKEENFVVPPLKGGPLDRYLGAVRAMMRGYHELRGLVYPRLEQAYKERFPRAKDYAAQVEKKAFELARYACPVAAQTTLQHTISAVVLMRLHAMANHSHVPTEAKQVLEAMVDAVRSKEPDIDDWVGMQELPKSTDVPERGGNALEFDQRLEGLRSKLIFPDPLAEEKLACAVRDVLGDSRLSTADAIARAMSPAQQPWVTSTLNCSDLDPVARTLLHVHYSFITKLSHTADSQNQRHRMVPGSRPNLEHSFAPDRVDVVWPSLFAEIPQAYSCAERLAHMAWGAIADLLDDGVPFEFAQYILPNATAVRVTETGSLLDLHHKLKMRLCYNAQEEIWRIALDQVRQIQDLHPAIGTYLGPPCLLRNKVVSPRCPDRFCGVPVWNLTYSDYARVF